MKERKTFIPKTRRQTTPFNYSLPAYFRTDLSFSGPCRWSLDTPPAAGWQRSCLCCYNLPCLGIDSFYFQVTPSVWVLTHSAERRLRVFYSSVLQLILGGFPTRLSASAHERFFAAAVKQPQRPIFLGCAHGRRKKRTFCSRSGAVSVYATQARGTCSVTTCFTTIP